MGVLTGFPYGTFYYTEQLEFKVFGIIPWTVPLAFPPLLLGTFAIASRLTRTPWKIIIISALLLVMYDLVFDPPLVLLNFWVWALPGCYYGVPLTNYLGWLLTGLIASSLLFFLIETLVNSSLPMPSMVASSLVLTVGFWSGFALWQMLFVPFIVSIILIGIMILVFIVPEKTNQNK
jgi:putative membrane protein